MSAITLPISPATASLYLWVTSSLTEALLPVAVLVAVMVHSPLATGWIVPTVASAIEATAGSDDVHVSVCAASEG